ncbi:MAG: DUF2283 domain-containing protein [Planctomycetota bacterium]|nr:DUF2283 domain-containing protein [Planctomycetota bacterium]
MAVETLRHKDIQSILDNLRVFLDVPFRRYWVDYDEEADVLYIGFRKPQRATDSELTNNGMMVRKRGSEIVGLTILEASKR